MRIAIDTSPLSSGHSGRGIGTYTRLLMDSLKTYYPEHDYVFSSQPYREKADVVHFPYFDFFFLSLPLSKPCPTIVTIHDAIPLVFPKAYPAGIRGKVKFHIQKYSLASVSHIVTDSFTSTQDVVTYLHQPVRKVSSVYLAPDPSYSPASKKEIQMVKEKFNLHKPYLLFVGDINYNKNIPGLFEAFAKIPNPLELVIVSKAFNRTNPAAHHLWKIVDRLEIEPRLKVLNDIPSHEISTLKGLYSYATWYIQPSFYEGFGLPVLEAQACGCPVISSIGGSLLEIIADSALSFDALQDQLVFALQDGLALTNDQRTQIITNGFANVKRFSWQKCASEMIDIFRLAYGSRV